MSDRAKKLTRQIVVRLPQDLYDRLESDADENGRTVAQSVRAILERRLQPPATTYITINRGEKYDPARLQAALKRMNERLK